MDRTLDEVDTIGHSDPKIAINMVNTRIKQGWQVTKAWSEPRYVGGWLIRYVTVYLYKVHRVKARIVFKFGPVSLVPISNEEVINHEEDEVSNGSS